MSVPPVRPLTIWLTGPPGAGKSTLGRQLVAALRARGRAAELVDGDEVRARSPVKFDFSREGRDGNVRLIGRTCEELALAGTVAVAACVSPYASTRAEVRAGLEKRGAQFVEIALHCPLATLIARDSKGLYQKAVAGEIANFTGISDPYEEPEDPDLVVDSSVEPVDSAVRRVLAHLAGLPSHEPTS